MRTPEILAPAGSEDALLAALRCGADAVYVGGKQFSARQNAANFDLPQLQRAAELCHLYGAKLYLTVNTLVFAPEFPALVQGKGARHFQSRGFPRALPQRNCRDL